MTAPRQPARHHVRHAERHEDTALSDVLSRSFWDDPVMSWMIPHDDSRYRKHRRFYRAELWSTRRRGRVLTTPDQAGAALWMPPGQWKQDKLSMARHAPALATVFGARIPAALKLLTELEEQHPEEPHWYLAILGTDPGRQGRGVGGALITEITDEADRDGLPAYLESSKEANVPYYERFGFRVTRELSTPGSPVLYAMWREPQ